MVKVSLAIEYTQSDIYIEYSAGEGGGRDDRSETIDVAVHPIGI